MKYSESFTKLKDEVLSYCGDSMSLSLEDRWEVAQANQWAFAIEGNDFDVYEFVKDRSFSWYDEFNVTRYSTVNMIDLVDEVPESFTRINELKEKILQTGVKGFIHDW